VEVNKGYRGHITCIYGDLFSSYGFMTSTCITQIRLTSFRSVLERLLAEDYPSNRFTSLKEHHLFVTTKNAPEWEKTHNLI